MYKANKGVVVVVCLPNGQRKFGDNEANSMERNQHFLYNYT